MSAADKLREAIKTFEARDKVYGKGFLKHGQVLKAMFPDGLTLTTETDFSRWVLFNMVLVKIMRYAENFLKGGHQDSIHDLGVYAFLLESHDEEASNDDHHRS